MYSQSLRIPGRLRHSRRIELKVCIQGADSYTCYLDDLGKIFPDTKAIVVKDSHYPFHEIFSHVEKIGVKWDGFKVKEEYDHCYCECVFNIKHNKDFQIFVI